MSRRTRIILALIAIYAIGMGALLFHLLADIDPRYRESAEDGLIETTQLLATVIEQEVEHGALPTDRIGGLFRDLYARRFSAQIYNLHKTRVELRAYVTNRYGQVVYDSTGRDLGQDYAHWRDVRQSLRGEYGARTTRDVPGDARSSVMYVGAPIRWQGEIVGVVTLGKPVQSFGQFVSDARRNIVYVGLVSGASALALALLLSFWLMRPLGITSDLLAALGTAWARDAQGRRSFSPRRAWRALRAQLRAAGHEVRDAIAGRNYVHDYVGQLTHELKSPISAVRGAAELLQEPGMPPEQAARFATNIARETHRMQEVVERMLELTALESRRMLQNQQPVPLAPMLQELAASARARAPRLAIDVQVREPLSAEGDAFLLRRAVGNLLDNAIEFSAPADPAEDGGTDIVLTLARDGRMACITVRDHGPGLPAYAEGRAFDKFFSLARPGSHKKSTGLGLAFVREIATLHQGSVTLANARSTNTARREPGFAPARADSGAIATLRLPAMNASP
ncbi:MAG: two-component system sensor histidine kinase CreC [Pseudomonadota bacterium]|nr:two-component system sensor histidine kinase CreC [Pseudomonadota bacterium]